VTDPVIYVNGEFVHESEARISVFDHAVLYGDGVFETVIAWNGRVFKLDAHIDRLYRSMSAIALKPHFERSELIQLILETVRRNELRDAYVKWLVTRGSNGMPLLDPVGCQPNVIIFARPYLYMAGRDQIRDGLRVKTTAIRRPSAQVLDPHIKSLNYLNLVLAKLEASSAGADEALLLDLDGHVCEAPGYNVFALRDGALRTPSSDILEGITRATVFDLAHDLGMPVSAATLELYDLYTADEVIFCSTAGGLLPVVELDGRRIGQGIPGPVYQRLVDAYQELIASDLHGTDVYPVPVSA
jgi:branched-chain amino acid aminotransferase